LLEVLSACQALEQPQFSICSTFSCLPHHALLLLMLLLLLLLNDVRQRCSSHILHVSASYTIWMSISTAIYQLSTTFPTTPRPHWSK
jgi:hypothetical protein